MNIKSLIQNAAVAFLAQGVTMLISCLTSLLVPKILGVEEFGYWQLFIFYASYVGFFHFGLNDGVYLVHGGEGRDQIDKSSVNSQFLIGSIFQLVLCVLIIGFVMGIDLGQQRNFVLICTAYYMVVKNASNYLGYVFQSMNETKLYSFSCILERIAFLLPLAALLIARAQSFTWFVLAYCASGTLQLLFCLWHARDFFGSGLLAPNEAARESLASVRIGIKLMIANIASQLILGVARFIIDALWGIKTFGELSLSLSMVNFVFSFVSQAAMVLFPALRQGSKDEVGKFFYAVRNFMDLVFPTVYLFYFPGVWLLSMWLPQYANSFIFFAYLLPICVFDGKMSIACTTCFKVEREEALLLKINIVTTCFSAIGAVIGGYALGSIWFIIGTVVVAIILRSVVSELLLANRLDVDRCFGIAAGELVITLAFVLIASLVNNGVLAFGLYAAIYTVYLLINRKYCAEVFSKIKRIVR